MSETTTPNSASTRQPADQPGSPPTGSEPSNGSEGVRAAAHDATEHARSLASAGMDEAATVVHEARSQASQLLDTAGREARGRVDEQLGGAARSLGEMSDELDRMAAASNGHTALGAVARDGATAMRTLSGRLDEGGVEGVLDDMRRFARRRPGTFVVGAFALGIVAGRVIRNTDLRSVREQAQSGVDQDGDTADGDQRGAGGDAWRGAAASTREGAGIEADWDAPTGGVLP